MASLGYFNSRIGPKMGPPSDEQLARINSRLENPLKKEDVFVFPALASNRNLDSYHSIMDDSSLKNYAKDYADGRAFMNGHRTNERPTGRTFDASFNKNTGEVEVWTYVLRGIQINDTPTDHFIRAVEGGIIQDVSIRFTGGDEICGLCNNKLGSKRCIHIPGNEYEWDGENQVAHYRIINAHAAELSDVYKGSTPEAGIVRKIRQMVKRGLLNAGEIRSCVAKYHLNARHLDDIPGIDNLKLPFEKYFEEDDDDDADDNFGVSPVTNLPKSQKMPDNYAEPHGNLDGRADYSQKDRQKLKKKGDTFPGSTSFPIKDAKDVENAKHDIGRSKKNKKKLVEYIDKKAKEHGVAPVGESKKDKKGRMDKSEFKGLIKVYRKQLEEKGSELSPEYIAQVRSAIEKWEREEDAEPPMLNKKKKDNDEDDHDEDERFLKPKKVPSLKNFFRALAKGEGKELLDYPSTSEMEPGKGHSAGMLMEGTDAPIANVASQMFQEIGAGTEIPTDAEIIKGLTELNTPLLQINPSGAMFLLNSKGGEGDGGAGVMDSSGSGLYVAGGRSEKDHKYSLRIEVGKKEEKREYRYQPITYRLDNVKNVRALVEAAMDGVQYRSHLQKELVRYGRIKDGKRFDAEFHLELADQMSTERLARYVDNMRQQASEKYRTNPPRDIKVDKFEMVSARQTISANDIQDDDNESNKRHDYRTIADDDRWFQS